MAWSWRWPTSQGKITAVDVERIAHSRGGETVRLAIAYKFSLGDDGPYTGESFWRPVLCSKKRIIAARRTIRVGRPIIVRYRSDDPSVNKLDRQAWRDL